MVSKWSFKSIYQADIFFLPVLMTPARSIAFPVGNIKPSSAYIALWNWHLKWCVFQCISNLIETHLPRWCFDSTNSCTMDFRTSTFAGFRLIWSNKVAHVFFFLFKFFMPSVHWFTAWCFDVYLKVKQQHRLWLLPPLLVRCLSHDPVIGSVKKQCSLSRLLVSLPSSLQSLFHRLAYDVEIQTLD